MKGISIDKPVFIVGTGRCGSTIFFKLLSHHPKVCWHSTLEHKYPNSRLIGVKSRFINRDPFYSLCKQIISNFKPTEIWDIWGKADPGFVEPCRALNAEDVSESNRKKFIDIVSKKVARSGDNRFTAKLTGWSRIPYLKEIFPDAVFVHVLRDGRAVANSLLHVDFWSGWNGIHNWRWGYKDEYFKIFEKYDESFAVLAGLQWKILVDEIENEGRNLKKSDFMTIRYEDLMDKPLNVMRDVCSFLDLSYTKKFDKKISNYNLRNMNYKWKENLTSIEKQKLNDFLQEDLRKYGYIK